MSQKRTPDAYCSLLKWAAKRAKVPFIEYEGETFQWVIVNLPYATHTDRHNTPYEIGCDLCFAAQKKMTKEEFLVRVGLLPRLNRTSYIYSPHVSWNQYVAPWGTVYRGTLCGSGNICRVARITDMVKLGILQQSRCEGHYTASVSTTFTCSLCHKEFRGRSTSDCSVFSERRVFVCPECSGGGGEFHCCGYSGEIVQKNMKDCRCYHRINELSISRSLASQDVYVRATVSRTGRQ